MLISKKATLTCALFFSMIVAGVGQQREDRSLDSFSELSVGESINVVLNKGSSENASLEVSGIDLDDVRTDVRGGKLRIHLENGRWRSADVSIHLTYVNLEEINISSSADVKTEGPIKADRLSISVSSSGDGQLELNVERLDISVSSSGDLIVEGRARVQDVSVSSSGDYDAYDLESEDVEVSASSSGSAKVFASKTINANASSGGRIRYRGNPDKVYVNANSGGSARKDG